MTKSSGWGGKRKNQTGRPPIIKTTSERIKNNYIKAANKLKKQYGIPLEEAVLGMVYDKKVQDTVKVAILKAYNEALLVKETEQNVNINETRGPRIGLPEMKPDPALSLIKGGKK